MRLSTTTISQGPLLMTVLLLIANHEGRQNMRGYVVVCLGALAAASCSNSADRASPSESPDAQARVAGDASVSVD